MTSHWYYHRNNETKGPVTAGQLRQLAAEGLLRGEDQVLQQGTTQWRAASTLEGLFPSRPATAEACHKTEAFDPYHKWLGIAPKDQPPNLYRLLGIEIFEPDADVIDTAADKQMTYLHGCSTGEYAPLAERLLNEIATARLCLLNPAKKSAYDSTLRTSLPASSKGTDPAAPSYTQLSSPSNPQSSHREVITLSVSQEKNSPSARRRRRGKSGLFEIAKTVVASIVVLGTVYSYLFLGLGDRIAELRSKLETHGRIGDVPAEPDSNLELADSSSRDISNGSGNQPLVRNPASSSQSSSYGTAQPSSTLSSNSSANMPRNNGSLVDLVNPRLRRLPLPNFKRVALPSHDDIEVSQAAVAKLYADEKSKAWTYIERVRLASRTLSTALETESPSDCFALLQFAKQVAIEAGDASLAMQCLQMMNARFEMNTFEEKCAALNAIIENASFTRQKHALAIASSAIANEAIDRNEFSIADQFLQLGNHAASEAKDKNLAKDLLADRKKVQFLQKEFAGIAELRAALAASPENSKANEQLGWFLGPVKNDWDAGLHYLEKSSDNSIAKLAIAERNTHPTTAQSLVIADQWWKIAENYREPLVVENIREHAINWYRKAAPGLSGIEKQRVAKIVPVLAEDVSHPNTAAVLIHRRSGGEQTAIALHYTGGIGKPDSKALWLLQDHTLILAYPDPAAPDGRWIEVCLLDQTGFQYTGENQYGHSVDGWIKDASSDWLLNFSRGPLQNAQPSDLVMRISYKSGSEPLRELRLLASGRVDNPASENRWVLMNDLLVLITPGENPYGDITMIDFCFVRPDGSFVGNNQLGTRCEGKMLERTNRFKDLLNQ